MADNYLEKRMDDYRSGKLSGRRVRSVSRKEGMAEGEMRICFPPMRILVAGGRLSPLAAVVVRQARAIGLNVAIMSDARKEASSLSQSVGARLYLSMSAAEVLADLDRHWGGVDVVLADEDAGSDFGEVRVVRLRQAEAPVGVLARFYLFLSHPENSFFTIS